MLTAIARLLLGTSLFSSLLSRPWFDVSEGVTMAEYAAAAYCPPEIIGNWTCPRCGGLTANFEPHAVVHDDAWNLQGYVGYSTELQKAMVVFSGDDREQPGELDSQSHGDEDASQPSWHAGRCQSSRRILQILDPLAAAKAGD
jgi:hypothetical protein